MTAPTPPQSDPQGMTIAMPGQQQAAAPAPPPEPTPTPQPMEQPTDRILTTEETENLFRGYPLSGPPDDVQPGNEQAMMAQAHFASLPPPPGGEPPPQPPAPQQQAAPQPPGAQQQGPPAGYTPPPAVMAGLAQQGAQQPPPAPPQQQQPQQVPVQQQADPQMAALQAQIQLLQTANANLQNQLTQVQQRPATPQPQQQPSQALSQQQPTYGFQVPADYLNALFASEEQGGNMATRAQALNGLLNGVAETVTRQVRMEMQQAQQNMPEVINPIIEQRMLAHRINSDMYGTYPELEAYRPYVEAAARSVQPMFAGQGWSPEFRDAVAERVAPMVPGLYQKIQQAKAQRVGYQQASAVVPYSLPQQQPQQALPPGVQPAAIASAAYGQPGQGVQAPVFARDQAGNYYPMPVAPQPYLGGPQARPGVQPVDPMAFDVQQTLGYHTG